MATPLWLTARSRCPSHCWVGLGQAVANSQAVLIRFQRLGEIALLLKHAADLEVGEGEIALRASIARVGLGQTVANGQA